MTVKIFTTEVTIMCDTCNSCGNNGNGCCDILLNTLKNLFAPVNCRTCGNNGTLYLVSNLGPINTGCGCNGGNNRNNGYNNTNPVWFNGVALVNGGNVGGLNGNIGGCGCNNNSYGCGCGNDPYYIRQYALGGCGCGCNN